MKRYKTDDRESFMYARRLIAEEGILVGGSSGSAMAAMVKAAKDLNLGKDDTIVVILPDSIRSYLSKFVDEQWLEANDLLPPSPPTTPDGEVTNGETLTSIALHGKPSKDKDPFSGATIRTLRLKPVTTVLSNTPAAEAIEVMRDKGFDQLPVKSASNSSRLVGLVTLGNLLSYVASGRAGPTTPVCDVMFDFSKVSNLISDPSDLQLAEGGMDHSKARKNQFVEITRDTPLASLSRFFEWNSAAVVTERNEKGGLTPIAVVTKVDLLSWLVRQRKE